MGSGHAALAGVFVALTLLLAGALPAGAQEWEPQIPEDAGTYPTGSIFIQNLEEIWTAAGDVLQNASILIEDGIIREIGTDLSAPDGVEVIDGSGMYAIPGLVDEHSHVAMAATNEGSAPIVPEVRVLDALRTNDFGMYRALSGGVTTARIMHGSANPIGGQSAVIKMRWGVDNVDDLLVPGAPRFVKFALGENVTRKGRNRPGSPVRFPASRPGVEAVYVEAFTAAQRYRDAWDEYRANPDDFRVPPRRDLRLEALVDIMEGRIRIHAHSYRSDEILMLMRVAERFGFKIDVFTHVLEGYQVAAEMAEHGAAGATFSDWWQYKLEAFDAIPHNAAIMHDQGVLTAINSDIPWLQAFMHLEYIKPIKYGNVSKEEALQMLTLNPARMMYIDDKVGSLEEGKQGDVVLLNGDPFSSMSRVEKTVVDGLLYFDLSREAETRGEPINPLPDFGGAGTPVAADPSGMGGSGASDMGAAASSSMDDGPNGSSGTNGGGARMEATQVETVALVGGTVHPVSGPSIDDGVVVMAGGRISAVGSRSSVQVPADARTVDVSGKHVYPGMIDPITQLGLFEFGQSPKASDTGETGRFNPHVRAVVAIEPHGPAIKVARANGLTAAMVTQTSGTVRGTAGVIQLKGDTWERVAIDAEAALVIDFPAPRSSSENRRWTDFQDVHEVHGDRAGLSGSAEGVGAPTVLVQSEEDDGPEPKLEGERIEQLVDLFRRAQNYAEGGTVRRDPTDPFWPNRDGGDHVILQSMVPVVAGERPVFFHVDSKWQIRTLFKFLDEFPEVRAVVVGGSQAYKVADELAQREIPVVLTGALSPTGDRDESITASYRNAAILQAAGVLIAFGTNDTSNVRNLPYHAAHSVAFGLPREAGLQAVTLNPARILGMGDEMGSLDAGKRADVIVTDGDPLEIVTNVERMWIAGEEVDPRDNKHDRLYQEFKDRR